MNKVGWDLEWEVPKFPPEEGKRRHRLVREQMRLRHLDCLVVAGNSSYFRGSLADVRYVANFAYWCDPSYVVFPFEGEPLLFIAFAGHKLYAKAVGFMEVRVYNYGEWGIDFAGSIIKRIKELGLQKSTIGITPMRWMAADVFLSLKEQLPEARLVDASDLIRQIRVIKGPLEMDFVRKAGECADKGFQAMLDAIRPGVKGAELAAACESAMVINGAELGSFILLDSGSWQTKTGVLAHGASQKVVKQGDIILNEITPSYGGFYVQLCRPISIGTPPDDFTELYEIHRGMYHLVRDRLKPGNKLEDIEAEVAELAKQKARGRFSMAFACQSSDIADLGVYPTLIPMRGEVRAGMGIVNHPFTADAVVREGRTGAIALHTVGDTYLVNETGAECVSKLPLELSIV